MTALHTLVADFVLALQDAEGEWTERLDALHMTLEHKLVQCGLYRLSLRAEQSALKAEIERLQGRLEALDNRDDRLYEYMAAAMQQADLHRVHDARLTLWLQQGPPSVRVQPDAVLPARYLHPPSPPTPDKRALREALDAGEQVEGVTLQPGALQLRMR